jgi:hypothetical protein
VTLAEHWTVSPFETFEGLHATLTDAMAEVWEEFGLMLAPPQPIMDMTPVNSRERYNLRFIDRSAFCIRRTPQEFTRLLSKYFFATAVNSGDSKARSLHICNEL